MPSQYFWTPPKRNTEDPQRPPLPGMERAAPRVKPGTREYHQAGNHEVWGALAHPSLHEYNPFLNHPGDRGDDAQDHETGHSWAREDGGLHETYERYDDTVPKMSPDRAERTVRKGIEKSTPAIAVSHHALHQILGSGRVKSQFETNTSRGMLSPHARASVENQMFGYPEDLPAHARPVYGYLTHNPSVQHRGVTAYGEHSLVLHRPRVWHRTTAFVGDSLDQRYSGHSVHPAQDFRLSGIPHHLDPKDFHLDSENRDHDIPYTEAQFHGGVGLRDVHYAVLHSPGKWARDHDSMAKHDTLKKALDHHRVPWVNMEDGKPTEWEHHEAALRVNIQRGAIMQPKHKMQVIGQQGEGRYLIDLGHDNEHGHRQAQVADINTGKLHTPMSKDSILARGYWEDPSFPVDVDDVLPHVTPE